MTSKTKTLHKQPDRAEALKRADETAEHDQWFRKQVQQAIDTADKPDAMFTAHDVVMGELKARLDTLAATEGDAWLC